MRLWHQDMINKLPRQQLLGQHRECCALRGNGWGRQHATVNYVFRYSPYLLYCYLTVEKTLKNGIISANNWSDNLACEEAS